MCMKIKQKKIPKCFYFKVIFLCFEIKVKHNVYTKYLKEIDINQLILLQAQIYRYAYKYAVSKVCRKFNCNIKLELVDEKFENAQNSQKTHYNQIKLVKKVLFTNLFFNFKTKYMYIHA